MQKGLFVTGTDTNVGKTWVGQHLISELRKCGIDVVPRKPVESGWAENIEETDAWKLANAAGMAEKIEQVCPFHFKAPVSPVRAARLENRKVSLNQLKQHCLSHVEKPEFLHIEGAGGFYSPLAENALNADLAKLLGLPILLVAEDRVGCINQILLTIEAAKNKGLTIVAIFLNRIENNTNKSMNNQDDLEELISIPIVTNIHILTDIVTKYGAN